MKKETKKQLIAIFILLMFGGSTLAFALMYVFPSEKRQKFIFDEPLSDSDESYFFQQNIVVARVYYGEPTDTVYILNDLVNVLSQKMVLERININQYPEIYDYMKERFETDDLPMILLRGRTEIYLNGEWTQEELVSDICSLYFEDIEECQHIS